MDEIEKRVRRSALKLLAAGVALGLLIGLGIGLQVGYSYGERVLVVPLEDGIKT